MMELENQTFIYRIDSDNKITYVSPSWDVFARENETPELCERNVKGQPLLDFFTGVEVKQIYKVIFDKIRSTKQSIEIPFRCDSPKKRRFMNMRISCVDPMVIEFETHIIREELRLQVELLDIDTKRGKEWIVICAWCKRVKTPGGWQEVEDAINEMKLFDRPLLPMTTHSICNKCLRKIENEL